MAHHFYQKLVECLACVVFPMLAVAAYCIDLINEPEECEMHEG